MTAIEFTLLFLCTAVFGSIVGAYLGTAQYRIRSGEPLITKNCHCPVCSHTLPALHQLPILSWFLLGGRCHYCHARISKIYPLTEGGFLLYYCLSFLLLRDRPILLSCLWMLCVAVLLSLRCGGHYGALLKGILIFSGYHILYGTLLTLILVS